MLASSMTFTDLKTRRAGSSAAAELLVILSDSQAMKHSVNDGAQISAMQENQFFAC